MSKPLYYAKDGAIFQRPVRTKTGVRMGFAVCDVRDGVDPGVVAAILNAGDTDGEEVCGSGDGSLHLDCKGESCIAHGRCCWQ